MAGTALAQSSSSLIDQAGDGNDADVFQDGSMHQSTINQNQKFNDGHEATVEQLGGDESLSEINQGQSSANAWVTQNGSLNESRLKQAGFNDADIDQVGDNNKVGAYSNIDGASAFQKNGTGSFASGFNNLQVEQMGDGNRTGIDQEANTDSFVGLYGNSNEAKVRQRGDNGGVLSESDVTVYGNNNMVDVFQGGSGPGIGGNTSTVTIDMGDFNMVDVDQLTSGNVSTVTIDGANNQSKVVQQ
jgi:hypothetical protein